jgi:hypothetical protein
MHMNKMLTRSLALLLVAGAVNLGGVRAALADDTGPAPIGQTEEGVPVYDEDAGDPLPGDPAGDITDADPLPQMPDCSHGKDCSGIYCDVSNSNALTNQPNDYRTIVRDVFANKTGTGVSHTVSVEKTTTTKFSVGVEVEEEIDAWIFAHMKAKFNANVEKSWETKVGEHTSFTVPAHKQYTTTYRVALEKVHFKRTHVDRLCNETVTISTTASAPYQDMWVVSSKNI